MEKALNLPDYTKPIIEQELGWLTAEFNRVIEDYKNDIGSLNNSLDRMSEKLGFYINDSQVYLPETELAGREFQRQMAFVKARFDSEFEREALLGQLQPSLSNLLNTIRKSQETVAEIMELERRQSDLQTNSRNLGQYARIFETQPLYFSAAR